MPAVRAHTLWGDDGPDGCIRAACAPERSARPHPDRLWSGDPICQPNRCGVPDRRIYTFTGPNGVTATARLTGNAAVFGNRPFHNPRRKPRGLQCQRKPHIRRPAGRRQGRKRRHHRDGGRLEGRRAPGCLRDARSIWGHGLVRLRLQLRGCGPSASAVLCDYGRWSRSRHVQLRGA
jgi:hypothetical protein